MKLKACRENDSHANAESVSNVSIFFFFSSEQFVGYGMKI